MPSIDDVSDLALREIDRIATGALPRTAPMIVPIIELIAKNALQARAGRISPEQAEKEIRRLGGRLRRDPASDQW